MNAFLRKLRHGVRLTEDDEKALGGLTAAVHHVNRQLDIAREGSEPRSITLILDGWACRQAYLENGKRQIISVLLPGDLCQPFGMVQPATAISSLIALTPVRLARLPPRALREAWQASPRIEKALWWDLLLFDALRREHVVSLGRRSATERLGYLFCELHLRLAMVGLADGGSVDMPLTQMEIADLSGLSTVHVNRSLQELRRTGLLSLSGRRLVVHDLEGLRAMAMFNPDLLNLHSDIGK